MVLLAKKTLVVFSKLYKCYAAVININYWVAALLLLLNLIHLSLSLSSAELDCLYFPVSNVSLHRHRKLDTPQP
jgi:hypothetical protein